jgi:phosphatidylethanolamine-binding protein (PEBP) family uncharacterized protein
MHSGLRPKTILSSVFTLIVALALVACGGSGSGSTSQASTASAASASQTASTTSTTTSSSTTTSASTSAASEKVPTINITLSSSAGLSPIPARYTCDGANESLPLSWSQLPANTVEVDVFLFNLLPVHGKLIDDWAVAGLKPKLHGLSAGKLPPGAIVGRNSFGHTGWSVCPHKGPSVRYAFLLYALPKRVRARPGFNAEKLRATALHVAESAGLLAGTYKRK